MRLKGAADVATAPYTVGMVLSDTRTVAKNEVFGG